MRFAHAAPDFNPMCWCKFGARIDPSLQ
uniref:Uncharacterized protein n=1 Tax=Arundo donax TaxID=35708 RepID=A0A0A9A7Z7_ARUDO